MAPKRHIIDTNEDALNEAEIEIEINEQEPKFLKGQTSKKIKMDPINVTKAPNGTLQREIMNTIQTAQERRSKKDQESKEQLETLAKDFSKVLDDPTAAPDARIISQQIKLIKENELITDKNSKNNKKREHKPLNEEIIKQRENLPIFGFKSQLQAAIETNNILIVIGETGSGKTTQMTQYIHEMGLGSPNMKIGCTQPRRIAARSVSKRVADEMGVRLGAEVGYSIRFEDCTSSSTAIKYMTDGMLLREALLDRDLNGYSVIILDEAHERTVNTDVLFGMLKETVMRRKDFKLIITSATLDALKFSTYFFDCNTFRIPGRTFPVQIFFTKEPETEYLEAALMAIMQIHLSEPAGDILLFLTGQEEIETACSILNSRIKQLGNDAPPLIPVPVYSSLPSEKQALIFEPAPEGSRKCVIATNIAEASITIDGIFYVVDPGFCKLKVYNPKLGMDSLVVTPISKASADQRAGRAGRTGPGKCYRLYTEEAYHNEMMPVTMPEIQRTNLANTVLILKALGIDDLLHFDFMDPPPVQTLVAALESLYALGALSEDGYLTRLGKKMAEFPLEPPLSKMLLASIDLMCSSEIITIIAMLSVQSIFYRPKDKAALADQKKARFSHSEGDHLTLLTVYDSWIANECSQVWCYDNFIHYRSLKRASDIRGQLLDLLQKSKLPLLSCKGDYYRIRKAICAGFFNHVARRDKKDSYLTLADEQTVFIHPSSALFNRNPEYVVYHELVMTSKEYMREVSIVQPKWLADVAPNFYKLADPNIINQRKRNERLDVLGYDKNDSRANEWRMSRKIRNLEQLMQ